MAYQPKSYRKFVATAATATLVATAVTPAFAASADDFTDVSKNYKEAVDYLVKHEIAKGVTATQFGIEHKIKRVDAASMIATALKLDMEKAPDAGFTDVPKRAQGAVNALKAAGIINGKTATKFGSDDSLTRGEMALIIQKAYKLTGSADHKFTDVAPNYDAAVKALVANDITKGKSETKFGTADPIKRGEFAIFLYKAETLHDLAVSNVTVNVKDFTATVTADVKNAKPDAEAAVQVYPNGNLDSDPITKMVKVKDGKATAEFDNLPAGNHIAKVTVGEAFNTANFTVKAPEQPEVASASAVNAKEVKITFSTTLDKTTAENAANYVLKLKGGAAETGLSAKLMTDGKTVLVSKADGADIFTNGDYYTLEVTEVLSKDLNKVKSYKSGILNYFDNSAPSVVSAELNGSNVRVYFSEPAKGVQLKVDGSALTTAAETVNKDGKYYVETLATPEFKKVGTHEVVVYNAEDAQGNKLSVASTQYVVANDTAAPSVVSVKADSATTFKVKVSEKLAAVPTFEVKKGGIIFGTNVELDSEDPTDLTYKVTVNPASGSYKLYETGEKTANLSVKITNIKDNSNLTGPDYTGSVTLSDDKVGPKVLSSNTNTVTSAGVIKVKFDEDITSEVDATKVKVYKNGVLLTVTPTATGTDDILSIALPSSEAAALATYSIQLAEGAVKDASGNANAALTTSATYGDTSNILATISQGTNKNQFKVDFTTSTDMTTSATTLSNYTLDGKALPKGSTVEFAGSKKTVLITLPEETVSTSTKGTLQISKNVVNTAGQKVADDNDNAFASLVDLSDNVKPVLKSGKFVETTGDTLAESVELTFSEKMDDTVADTKVDDYEFIVNGAKVEASKITYAEDKAIVTFASQLNVGQALTVKVIPADQQEVKVMDAKDASEGNVLTAGTTITVNTVK
ncbi:S-layer homology domain-containing protein [Pseudobacillus badius]|uniref:S-layer homology domain-containing protein n=1 Tax=Bacillus badius TaxID=1455 RepID=UPI003CFB7D62